MKYFLIILSVIFLGFCFYWYQIRPAQIKHDCSWIKKHANAIPAKEGLTEDQLRKKGLLEVCPSNKESTGGFLSEYLTSCDYRNAVIIDENRPQKYIPAKDWWEKATKDQYTFCLHDKGL